MTPIEIVEAFIEGWNQMDWETVVDLLADDVVYHNIPMEKLEGKAAAEAFIRGMQADAVDWAAVEARLQTAGLPDPDLIIRTSGEFRLSNFLLLQSAYAEIVFASVFWPDFDKAQLQLALAEYAKRERRFGMTGAQVQSPAQT